MKKRIGKYMIRSCTILLLAVFLSLVLQVYGVGKENILLFYMVSVQLITVCTTGYLYGAVGAVLGVLIFNYFFTTPLHTFAINSENDVVLMIFFLITAFISSSLTVRFRRQAQIAEDTKAEVEREHLKNSMLRSISHDFRTPLTGIMGGCDLLTEPGEMDEATRKKLAEGIREQAVWIMKMMDNILSMTRIETGKLEIKKEPEVVDDIIYDAAAHVTGLREHRNFKVQLPEQLVVAPMDGKMMVQVMVNLLDNAMKHTKEGDYIAVRVTFSEKKVYFNIEDEGDGISEEIKDQIFEEFITGSGNKEDGYRGIGLGLAICKAVVEAHGGEIWAENREEGGARFVFRLDAQMVDEDGR